MTHIDDVTLEVAWSRMISACDEGATALRRASVSVIIGDVADFSVALVDASGEMLATSRQGVSLFDGSMGLTAQEVLQRFPLASMREGDTFACNDPWMTSGHLPDVFLCSPVFHRGRAIGLAATIGHVTDIGGSLRKLGTTEVFEEGLRFPPLRFLAQGVEREDFVEFIRFNTRTPEMVLSDFHAQVGAHRVVGRRVGELLEDLGQADLRALGEAVLTRSEQSMRDAVRALAPGEYVASELTDGLIEPALIRVSVGLRDTGDVIVDFSGSSDESTEGSANAPLSCTRSQAVSTMHTVLLPGVPMNSGGFRPIRVVAPEGSMFNTRRPRSVNARTKVVFRADPVILAAMAQILPERVMGAPGLSGHYQVNGSDGGDQYVTYLMLAGGMGGSAHGPGQSCLWFPGTIAGTSVEVLEDSAPLLVSGRSIIRGSGGDGRHRGGDGEEFRLRLRPGHAGRAVLSTHPQMLEYPGGGVLGGGAGAVGHVGLNGRGIPRRELNAAGGIVPLGPGDEIVIGTPGGGGFGLPRL